MRWSDQIHSTLNTAAHDAIRADRQGWHRRIQKKEIKGGHDLSIKDYLRKEEENMQQPCKKNVIKSVFSYELLSLTFFYVVHDTDML